MPVRSLTVWGIWGMVHGAIPFLLARFCWLGLPIFQHVAPATVKFVRRILKFPVGFHWIYLALLVVYGGS